ncbi:MAG: hypothetical protein UU29_C0008G0156 [Candidatus Daviesbacteria bacterium GW2011_GWA2_40_9]|uniref:ArnT-like N-terminal domain-containing protein n=1 Tax=Candidatus Daviesbacteria bacterium GW2011_GWA2_40_9 TaxID=1618424 RepID=A0A0G0X5X6_9BACT|nr:MAG: hypothetical protein UU29_C0008G0156 [Candidatus Daviesbacteria bacterium GW2011_GWA2_40_9]
MYFSRYLTSVIGILTMVLTYLIGKKLFNSRLVALLSVSILAVNLRAVSSSQVDLPDAYSSFFLLLAFFIVSILKDRPTLKLYILSGLGVGLAISSKLQFFSLLPLALIHLYHTVRARGWRGKITTFLSQKVIFCVLSLVLTVVLVNIGPLTHWQKFTETITRVSHLYGFGFNKFSLTGLSFFYQIVLTPAVAGIVLLGIVVGLLKYRFSTFLVLSMIIVYLYYFLYLTRGWFYPRNFVSIIPFFALMGGVGLASGWYFLKKYLKNSYLAMLFFVLVVVSILFQSTKNSVIHTLSYMKPWNITSMRQCLSQNILEGKTVAAHPTDKYILFALPSIDVNKKLNFIPINIESSYSLAELQEEKADYVLVGLDVVGDQNSVWWMTKAGFWQKPKEISNNVFVSLAAKELFASAVCSQVKPWQAVENNYFFATVPSKVNLEWEEISQEGFDKRMGSFKKVDGFGGQGDNLVWDEKEGREKNGSVEIKAIIPTFPVVMWVSPVFTVKAGEVYKAEGWVKGITSLEQKRRDGFLRLDFYQNKPTVWDEGTESLSTNLSPRYFGPKEWQKLEVVGRAPANAQLATVSFQVSNFSTSDFWLDDLVIYQSKTEVTLTTNPQDSQKLKVDPDVFVPNLGSGY